jgi:hypothetical protein
LLLLIELYEDGGHVISAFAVADFRGANFIKHFFEWWTQIVVLDFQARGKVLKPFYALVIAETVPDAVARHNDELVSTISLLDCDIG